MDGPLRDSSSSSSSYRTNMHFMTNAILTLLYNVKSRLFHRDVPVIHSILGICRVSHHSVLLGPGKIISPSKFNFFKVRF